MARPRKQKPETDVTIADIETEPIATAKYVGPTHVGMPSVIRPTVTFKDGEQHVLQTLEQEGNLPIMKAVGYMPVMSGKMSWVAYTVTFQGTKIISIDVDEPNLRAIAEESAKMAFMEHFADQWFESEAPAIPARAEA